MRHRLPCLLALLLTPLTAASQELLPGATATNKDEFPALQFLPEGSVVHGITIPRYQNHKAISLLKAEHLRVESRSLVTLQGMKAFMYGEGNITTRLFSDQASYDFKTRLAQTTSETEILDPRFTAKGSSAAYSTSSNRGLLRGPVHTTVNSSGAPAPTTPPQPAPGGNTTPLPSEAATQP